MTELDRTKLRQWLDDRRRTWRWSRGETTAYQALEATLDSLRWYSWTHDLGLDETVHQSVSAFRRDGPPAGWRVPTTVTEQLRAWLGSAPG